MKSHYKIFLFLGLMAIFLQILIGFPILIENQDEAQKSSYNESKDPEQSTKKMQGVHLVESQAGARDWELFSESAESQKEENVWQIKKVKVHFYRKDALDFVGMGASGSINTNSKDLEITGSVSLTSTNGYKLETEKLFYLAQKRLLVSPSKVKMKGPSENNAKGVEVSGSTMEIRVDDGALSLSGQVETHKQMEDGKTLTIKSEKAEFSSKSKSVSFSQNVRLYVNQLKIEAPQAKFQYTSDGKSLESMQLFGGTKIFDFDKFATSDAVTFFPKENKFVLNGTPRVVQNNDEILGEVITFLNGGKKVKVQNIRAKIEKQ
jgi:LPS export ABC transporter protein LptC/lipopolysaccharide transport protein LptA